MAYRIGSSLFSGARVTCILVFLLLLTTSSASGQVLDTIEQRAKYAIQLLPDKASQLERSHHIEFQLWAAESLYLRGLDPEARTLILNVLPQLHEPMHPDDDCFNLIATVDIMERWSSHFQPNSDSSKNLSAVFESTLTGFPHWDTAHTSNQLLMAAAARFLASEAYPKDTFASDFVKGDPTGRAFLLCIMNQIATHNLQEFDSNVYSGSYFISLRVLADFARDPEIKKRAAMTYDWLLANAASTWLNSSWAASSFRRYADIAPQNQFQHGSWTLWPYLGGPLPGRGFNIEYMLGAIQAAASCQCVSGFHKEDGPAYTPRQEILDLVSWSKAATHYNFSARTITPSRPTYQFMQSSYITPNYALFGETDFETSSGTKIATKASGAAVLSGVVWNPSASMSDYPSTFYAGAPRWRVDTVSTGVTTACSKDSDDCAVSNHTYGSGQHGQYFQVQNAQVGVYNYHLSGVNEPNQFYIYAPLCTNNPYPWRFTNGPIPNFPCRSAIVPRAMIATETATKGRLYLFYDNVLISLWLSAPFKWDGLHELSAYDPAALNPHSQLASALEVASPSKYAGATDAETLLNYKKWIETHASLDVTGLTGDHPYAVYTASDGDILKNVFGGTNYLNGTAIDYLGWPLMWTPWVQQVWDKNLSCTICTPAGSRVVSGIGGGQNLTVTSPVTGRRLVYDFVNWTVTESAPPRAHIL
jgi:hypothetical protein